jgi:hypothetical protein
VAGEILLGQRDDCMSPDERVVAARPFVAGLPYTDMARWPYEREFAGAQLCSIVPTLS